jgi:hypothetical protein
MSTGLIGDLERLRQVCRIAADNCRQRRKLCVEKGSNEARFLLRLAQELEKAADPERPSRRLR